MAGSSGKRALPRDSSGSLGAPARKAWDGGGLQTARPGPPRLAGGECPQERGGRPHCLVFSELLPRCVAHFQTALQPSRRERCSPGPLRKQGHGGGGAGGGASCAPAPSPQPLPASGSPAAWLTAQRSALCQTTRPSCKTGALHPSFYSADREQTKPKDTPSHDSRACGTRTTPMFRLGKEGGRRYLTRVSRSQPPPAVTAFKTT